MEINVTSSTGFAPTHLHGAVSERQVVEVETLLLMLKDRLPLIFNESTDEVRTRVLNSIDSALIDVDLGEDTESSSEATSDEDEDHYQADAEDDPPVVPPNSMSVDNDNPIDNSETDISSSQSSSSSSSEECAAMHIQSVYEH